jgi:hypothetical protein
MSAELELHKTVIAALLADATLGAMLAPHKYKAGARAVYDYVDQSAKPEDASEFPYIVVGDTTAAQFDTDDINGQEHTLALHIWDRYRGTKRIREIQGAIYDVLHEAELVVAGHFSLFCYYDFSGSVNDPDVPTEHGVVRYRIVTQSAT